LLLEGAQLKATRLTDSFDFDQYCGQGSPRTVFPLFALNPKGYALPFTQEQPLRPEAGWTVIGLHVPAVPAAGVAA
jgi:hypothetical protein